MLKKSTILFLLLQVVVRTGKYVFTTVLLTHLEIVACYKFVMQLAIGLLYVTIVGDVMKQ